MTKTIGYVIAIFFGIVLIDYLGTMAASAFSGIPAFPDSSLNSFGSFDGSSGLSSINFSFFAKNGVGWSYITQGYGRTPYSYLYVNGWHNGVDIGAKYGAPIYSPVAGMVIATGNQDNYCPGKGFGKFVALSDPADNVDLWFAHLGTFSVTPGEDITKGTELGTIGDTGLETGTHLHFSVFEAKGFSIEPKYGCGPDANGQDVNPVPYLQKFGQE